MRNLKRALSLALASVMLLGMMVVGSSAKGLDDFSDNAEIVNKDAVAVTSAIGLFDGYEDGSFGPENVVTRAEMAVIICTMLYGAGVNVNQFAETNVFTDVPAWAQGYVNLCSSLGIVAGVGDGKFDPNATVTTAQAVLMLCRALGYFQSAADFGDNWMLAATAKGTQLGLYGDLKLTANEGLTRDNVAELVFNALTKAVPVQYNELLGVYYNENQGIIYSLEFNYLQTLGYKNFDLVYRTDTETIYGRPATTWGTGSYNARTDAGTTQKDEYLTENGGLIADKVRMLDKDEIITVPNTPDYVYTANTDEQDVYKDLGATVCNNARNQDEEYTWTVFVNGEEVFSGVTNETKNGEIPGLNDDATYGADDEKNLIPENEKTKYQFTDKGTVTEIYIDDYTLDVTVVEINYYLGEVTTVKDDDDGTYVSVRALSDEPKSLDDRTFYTSDFEEDDYVVFTVDFDEDEDFYICELMAPETVTGEVTRVDKNTGESDEDNDNTYVRIDGNKYTYASKNHNVYDLDEGKRQHPTLNEDYTLYMTPEGYILGYALADQSPDQYLYVEDSDEEMGDWQAKVVLEDGTSAKVELKNDYVKVKNGTNYSIEWVKENGQPFGEDEQIRKVRTSIDGHVFSYTVNDDGVYTLTMADHLCWNTIDADQAKVTDVQIHNGKAYIEAGVNEIIVDRDTIFVDVDNNVAYTGYDEVPNVDNADIAYAKDGRTAEVVFIVNGEIYDENSTYFMLAKKDRESLNKDDDFWEYTQAYVDGQKQNVIVAYDALQKWDDAKGEWVKDEDNEGKSLKVGVLYKAVKSDSDGYFTAIRPVELADEYVTEVANDAFWVTDNHSYAEKDWIKYDTDGETIFVVVEQTYDKKGNKDKLVIDDGNIDDMFVSVKANGDIVPDEDGYYSYVSVIEEDEEYAELVYIWLTKDELTYSDEDAAVADLGKVTGLDGKTAEQLADLLTDIQDNLDKKVSPKTLKDLKAAVDEIKAAQKALTDAQNNAKAALNDYADNILDTYEGKLTAKQARDIAAAVDAGEEAIDAAAKTGVNGALDGAKAAIDEVAKDAVDETADEKLVADAGAAIPAEVTVKERASTGDKPTGQQLNQYTLKDYKIDGVTYTVSDPADWNTLTAGTDDTYVGTATVTMTAGKATATKEIKVSFVATDYENVKEAAEAIGTEVRVEVKASEISSGVDTAIKTALEAKCEGVEITATVNGTVSGSEGDILYKTAEITIADKTVSATSYEVTIDVTIDVTAG
ncbi:S-layer homology domain-containing protein [Clostridium sp. DFI.5.61]|uniref:S-layer homology domain-containing protein n=1 Tax=Clostridium sp. DFI.5.61 TaxID=2965279 RepID=UPI002109AC74|nr:S-layer homology domain-containing protein [Clostridium sp. DFI.5.61]MCQ5160556.1 S-layer homology domain-containing protein [Clostridium sp. DFI.5.61]